MPRKTTILIVILAVITAVLIFLAVRSDQTLQLVNNLNKQATPTPTTIEPYASLSFSKPNIDVSKTSQQSVDILIDTAGKPTAGAQVELTYDPKVLTNLTIVKPQQQFFGTNPMVLINSVDTTQGRISYAVGISPNDSEKTGKGVLVTLNFTATKTSGITVSQITFLPKSTVQTLSTPESVLKSSTPLTVTFSGN